MRRYPVFAFGLSAALLCGCAIQKGVGWDPGARSGPRDARVTLVLIGDTAPGRPAQRVAEAIEATMYAERALGREPVLLWLGNSQYPTCGNALDGPGTRDLARVSIEHRAAGGASYGIAGHRDWRCERPARVLEGEQPFEMPAFNYVVRVDALGRTRIVSSCEPGENTPVTCSVAAPEAGDLFELVMVDPTTWFFAPEEDSPNDMRSREVLAELDAIIGAVRDAPQLPKILVSHIPIEAAGMHGMGGAIPSATTRNLPPALRDAVVEGVFVGAVSAHDRQLMAATDVSGAAVRSSKAFYEHAVFQVVSGAAGRPDGHTILSPRSVPGYWSQALRPQLLSTHTGFARVIVGADSAELVLHSHRAGKWQQASVTAPMRPEPLPAERSLPEMQPCLYCDPVTGAADSDTESRRPD